jgi:hypothetical protein
VENGELTLEEGGPGTVEVEVGETILVAGGEDAAQPECRPGGEGLGQAPRGSERVHGSGGASPSLEHEYSCESDGHSASRDGERLRGSGGASPSLEDQDSCGADGRSASGDGERLHGSGGDAPSWDDDAGVVDRSDDDRAYDEARRNEETGRFDKNFANEPKSGDYGSCNQALPGIEVSANFTLCEQANVVKSDAHFVKSEGGEGSMQNGEPTSEDAGLPTLADQADKSIPVGGGEDVARGEWKPSDESGGQAVDGYVAERERRSCPSEVRVQADVSGIPPGQINCRRLERKRRRREKERIERMRIEHRIEEKLRSGKVISASKLIEEALWPPP